jgi:hypothetical protein
MKAFAIEKDVVSVDAARFTDALLREEAHHAWELHQTGSFVNSTYARMRKRRC